MPSPVLSIVIPTRNNQKYAHEVVRSILRIPTPDFELVVQDNSDSRGLQESIREGFNDPRLRYSYIETPLSVVGNFEEAVKLSSGTYVCLIGDDDGINPEIIEAAHWAHRNNIDALSHSLAASYVWPDPETLATREDKNPGHGLLTIRPFAGAITNPDPETEMKSVVRRGGWNYQSTKVPRLYHGLVRRECLAAIRQTTGQYFGGLIPDIYSAMAIANVAKTIVFVDYPLTIGGVSKTSASAAAHRGEHVGTLDITPGLRHRGAYEWSDLVPPFYSVQTVWADSAIAALKAFGRDDLLRELNLPLLAADCLVANPRYGRLIMRNLRESVMANSRSRLRGVADVGQALLTGPGWSLAKRGAKRLRVNLSSNPIRRFAGAQNMVEATNLLTRYLEDGEHRFSKYVG